MNEREIARLKTELAKRPAGEFHFPEVYGSGWDRLYIGDKVKTGREFLEAVRRGLFPGVEDTGTKKGGRLYRWRGE
ncbi:DUF1413 domain-containing protein [Amorphus sp. 3PC139-8]|uniref:DUF1413 domain-containing protein n=1 Tax=Amorphus sp. 3PC139-8 TaxID=2735676 RepID=UPI00345E065A